MEQMVWAMFGLHPDNFSLEDTFQELRSRYVICSNERLHTTSTMLWVSL